MYHILYFLDYLRMQFCMPLVFKMYVILSCFVTLSTDENIFIKMKKEFHWYDQIVHFAEMGWKSLIGQFTHQGSILGQNDFWLCYIILEFKCGHFGKKMESLRPSCQKLDFCPY